MLSLILLVFGSLAVAVIGGAILAPARRPESALKSSGSLSDLHSDVRTIRDELLYGS